MRIHYQKFLTLVLLMISAVPTWAMTQAQAVSNLVFLAAARNEGAFCEQYGNPAVAALAAWEAKNYETLVKSMKTIEDHAVASRNFSKREASGLSTHLMVELQHLDEREVGPTRNQAGCSKFPQTLALYESKLTR